MVQELIKHHHKAIVSLTATLLIKIHICHVVCCELRQESGCWTLW
jgi:hypothetical protein